MSPKARKLVLVCAGVPLVGLVLHALVINCLLQLSLVHHLLLARRHVGITIVVGGRWVNSAKLV